MTRPQGEAEQRIRDAANDARLAAIEAEERKLTLAHAADTVDNMRRAGADEQTMAAFVATVLAKAEAGS